MYLCQSQHQCDQTVALLVYTYTVYWKLSALLYAKICVTREISHFDINTQTSDTNVYTVYI